LHHRATCNELECGSISSSGDKILINICGNLIDFLSKVLSRYSLDKHWKTFCDSCAQSAPSNALQESVCRYHFHNWKHS